MNCYFQGSLYGGAVNEVQRRPQTSLRSVKFPLKGRNYAGSGNRDLSSFGQGCLHFQSDFSLL